MSITLGGGIVVEVEAPALPTVKAAPPVNSMVVVPPSLPAALAGPPEVPTVRQSTPSGPDVLALPVVGPPGLPGADGSTGAHYLHSQSAPASAWQVHHGLSGYPSAVVLTDTEPNRPVWADVEYVDADSLILTFPTPVTGRAYL